MKKLLLFVGFVLLMMLPIAFADTLSTLNAGYTFDDPSGTVIRDYTGKYNGTYAGNYLQGLNGLFLNKSVATGNETNGGVPTQYFDMPVPYNDSFTWIFAIQVNETSTDCILCDDGNGASDRGTLWQKNGASTLVYMWNSANVNSIAGISVPINLPVGVKQIVGMRKTASNVSFWVNGSLIYVQNTSFTYKDTGLNWKFGNRDVNALMLPMVVDEAYYWGSAISDADMRYVMNNSANPNNITRPWNISAGNTTISAYNVYTNASITNFTAYITNGSVQINQTTTNGTIQTIIPTNSSYLWNITLESNESGGYFNETYTSVNVSSNVNKSMAQNTYSFYAVEKVTGNNLTGFNFSSVRGSTTYAINQTHYLSNGTYDITAFKTGYYNKTTAITATNLFNGTQNISYVGNHSLNITARDNFTNALINSFSVRVVNTTYSYTETYSTTNGIILDNTTSVQLTYEASATGYFNTTGVLTLTGNSSNNTIIMTPYGGLQVKFIRSSNGSLILTPTQTVMFQNTTNSTSFTGTNGTANVTNLVEDTYLVLCQVTGFDNNTYAYDYPATTDTHPSIFYCVMSVGTTPITFQIQSPDLTPLGNVLIQIEQFVNGSFATVASDYTDGTGQSVLNLVQGLTTRITLSLAGYTTQVNVNSLDATTYTYTLDPVNRFDPSNSAGSSITYSFYPTQFDLNLSVWGFTLNVTPDSGTLLDYFKITIANASGSIITQFNSTNSSGGNITIPFNTTPYNGSTLRVTYSFKKINSTEFQVLVVYNIADNYVTGSIIGARNYILANFDLGERIFLWMFLTICSALLLSALGIKDLLNVFLTSVIWLGLAYVFAMNTIIVGLIFFLLFLAIVRYTL